MRTVGEGLGEIAAKLLATVDRPNLLRYTPHDAQRAFHGSMAQQRLFIGGNRSGKTTAGAVEGLYRARGAHPYQRVPEPPTRGRIVAVDFPNGHLQIIHPVLKQWLVPSDLVNGSWEDSYSKQDRQLTFANGSTIQMNSADSDLEKHAGTSRHWVWVDEECPKTYWTENRARVIDTGGVIWLTMTAVAGQTWSYDDLYVPGLGLEGKPKDPRIFVVQVSMDQNPYLSDTARADFLSGLSEDDRAARVRGDYAVVGGLIFRKFDKKIHVVPATAPPESWPIYASMDHGLNAPTCWLYHAVGPDGQVLTFAELYEAGVTVPDWAARVLAFEHGAGRIPEYRVGDPSIRNQAQVNGSIVSVQGDYLANGVSITLGSNDVPASINRIRRYLERPGMWAITADCHQLARQMGRYRWRTPISSRTRERVNPYEEPVKKDDHAVDAARYFFMSRPDLKLLGPVIPTPAKVPSVPGTSTTMWPGQRVVPEFTPAERRDADIVPASEWEINESIGAIW